MDHSEPGGPEAVLRGYPEVLSTAQVADVLHLRARSVAVMAARGSMRGLKIGGQWWVPKAALYELITGCTGPEPLPDQPDVLTSRHLAEGLMMPRRWVTERERARDVPGAFRLGGQWRFLRAPLVEALTGTSGPDPLHGEPDVLTTRCVAACLHATPERIARLAHQGVIPGAFKVGGEWRFSRAGLIRLALGGPIPRQVGHEQPGEGRRRSRRHGGWGVRPGAGTGDHRCDER